jgi:hypothetical protein
MAVRRTLGLASLTLLSACMFVGPIVDPSLKDAPYAACSTFAADSAATAEAEPAQCFTLLQRGPNGGMVARASNQLRAGDEVLAVKSSAPACQGEFTDMIVSGDTTGPGEMRLEVVDAVGRGSVGRTVRWGESRTGRRWTVGDIDSTLQIPGTVRLHLLEGEVRLSGLCWKSYGDLDLPF